MLEVKNKEELRKRLLLWRICLLPDRRGGSSRLVFKRLRQLPIYTRASCVLCYISAFNEIDTTRIIDTLLKRKATVCVPTFGSATQTYLPGKFLSWLDVLYRERYGPTLKQYDAVDPKTIELAICPGIAFDASGNRLGFGKGYFDRLLALLPEQCIKIGLAYNEQIVHEVPHEPHDIRMDMVITDKEIVEIQN